MKLSGSAEVPGAPDKVFAHLLDPALIARCIPGCERLEEVAPGVYETVVSAGRGLLKGHFAGRVVVSEVARPESYTLSITGHGPGANVEGSARLRLTPAAAGTATRVSYEGEGRVRGIAAAFGGRLLEGAAKSALARFFERLVEEAGR